LPAARLPRNIVVTFEERQKARSAPKQITGGPETFAIRVLWLRHPLGTKPETSTVIVYES